MKTILINGKRFYVFNVDENKLNYSQRNNQYKWSYKESKVNSNTTCNCTSICMALDYAGYNFPKGQYDQPEDNLAKSIMESNLVDEEYKKRYPAMYADFKKGLKDAYTPNEIHKLLEIGTNEWMGCDVDKFYESYPIVDLIEEFTTKQSPVVTSGRFPDGKKPNGEIKYLNHIVCITGVVFSEDKYNRTIKAGKKISSETPDFWIVDDPWGYTLNYASGKSGNDVYIPNDQFIAWIKPVNNTTVKFAHILRKPVAVV